MGFRYKWDKTTFQWIHSPAAYVVTPEGKLSFYHYALEPHLKTMRLSLVEASDNKIGNVVDRLLLFFLQYDPSKKGYALHALNIMKAGGAITMLLLGGFLFSFWRKPNANNSQDKEIT